MEANRGDLRRTFFAMLQTGVSGLESARRLGVTERVYRRWMSEREARSKFARVDDQRVPELRADVEKGLTTKQIAIKYGICRKSAWQWRVRILRRYEHKTFRCDKHGKIHTPECIACQAEAFAAGQRP